MNKKSQIIFDVEVDENKVPTNIKWSASEKDKGSVIVAGDSDFMTNKDLNIGFNKNLALNIFSYLAGEYDLVSIQPKVPAGSQLLLTESNKPIIIVSCLVFPIFFLLMSFVVWFRRKNS